MAKLPDDKLTQTEVAEELGLTYGSFRTLRSVMKNEGYAKPDGYFGATPWWYRFRVKEWKREREAKQPA